MKTYRVRYTPEASRIIKKLHPTIKAVVRAGIRDIMKDPLTGRELLFELRAFRSFRISRYRIIYRVNHEEEFSAVLPHGPSPSTIQPHQYRVRVADPA